MNAKALLLIAASLALAGCPDKPAEKPAAPGPKVTAPPPAAPAAAEKAMPSAPAAKSACPPACEVVITVAEGCKVGPATPDKLTVAHGVHVIRFTLSGPQKYSFDGAKGIDFKEKGVPFESAGGGTPKVVVLTDKNDVPAAKGEWRYNVNVTDGTTTCKLDPSVINDP